MGSRLALWLTDEEKKEIEKLRVKAKEQRRSLSNYCKKILFNFENDK